MKAKPKALRKKKIAVGKKDGQQKKKIDEKKGDGKNHRKGWKATPIVLKKDWSQRGERRAERIDVCLEGRFVFGTGCGSMSRRVVDGSLQNSVED